MTKNEFIKWIYSDVARKRFEINKFKKEKEFILSKFSLGDLENPKLKSVIEQWFEIFDRREQAILG